MFRRIRRWCKKVKEIYEEYYNRPAVCCTSVSASYTHYIEGAVSTGVASPGVDTMPHKSDEFMFIKDLLLIGETYTGSFWISAAWSNAQLEIAASK